MKRFATFMALLLALLPALALAQIRMVDNQGPWDRRLNLRTRPDKSAASLGRYYTGTRVRVLEDLGEWSHVSIEMGTRRVPVEGYMMNAYLRKLDGEADEGLQPYAQVACEAALTDRDGNDAGLPGLSGGEWVHVLAYCEELVHVLTADGRSGFLRVSQLNQRLAEPQEDERIARERCAVTGSGATLRLSPDGDAEPVAKLYGGVFLSDVWFLERWKKPLVFLGDTGLGGYLMDGEWTWTDNGASCGCMYDVYRQDGQFVQVIGELPDGRLIVSRGGEISAQEASALDGAQKLTGEPGASALAYEGPMPGELGDGDAVSFAIRGLLGAGETDRKTGEPLTRQALAALRPVVKRVLWPQWDEMTSLYVQFEDGAGEVRAFAEIDPRTGSYVGNGNG